MEQIQAGKPVTGYEFIGRSREVTEISDLILAGQSIVLIAPRRFGKTSMMLKLIRSAKYKGFYTGYSDIFTTPTIKHLAMSIVRNVLKNNRLDLLFNNLKNSAVEMLRNARFKALVNENEFMLGFAESKTDQIALLSDTLDFIDRYVANKGKRMLYCFDEFGDITNLGGESILKLIRSKIQLHKNTTYVFSGSYESLMNRIFTEKSSPFFRFARIYNLGYIDKADFARHFKRKLKAEKIGIDTTLISSVLDFTRGHPYYTQLALQQIILGKKIDSEVPTFKKLKLSMLQLEEHYLEKLWEDQMARQEDALLLLRIAEQPVHIYSTVSDTKINVARALNSLVNSGTVFRNYDKSYTISDPLFEYWIKQTILI